MIYLDKHTNQLFFKQDSIIYSIPTLYSRIMADNRSWHPRWEDAFGRNGAIGYEWDFLGISPSPQPNFLWWCVHENKDLATMDLERTLYYHKVKVINKPVYGQSDT